MSPLRALLGYAIAVAMSWAQKLDASVETRMGTIIGSEEVFLEKTIWSFLGVPFAEPPVGERRFKPPEVIKPWKKPLIAKTLSRACYQGRDEYNSTFWGSEMWNANTEVSEDCLYLNIWAPKGAKNLTVMVWLFGGGFWYGSPSLDLYDGRALAATGNVIVVNVNYRLGPYGFLYFNDPEVPGNMGMIDQQFALHFIKDNIVKFGGDPDRISLFGESAGASSIVAHMIANGSRDLFKNGILQSGALDNKWAMDTPQHAYDKSKALANLTGCWKETIKETIGCLRRLSPAELTARIWETGLVFLEFPFVLVSRDRNFFREKDGFVALREGDFRNDVNVMIGINHDEGNFWNIYNLAKFFDKKEQPQISKADFEECVETAFAAQSQVMRNAAKFVYSDPNCTYGTEPSKFYAEQVNQMVGDYFFTCDSLWMADMLTKKRREKGGTGKVFIYYFDQESSANPWPAWTGVMHGYEIEFVFGAPIHNNSQLYKTREKAFSERVIEYWTSFSTDGVPTVRSQKSEYVWPAYDGETNRIWMYLKSGSHTRVMNSTKRLECDLWRHSKDGEYKAYQEKRHLLVGTTTSIQLFISIITSLLAIHCLPQ